MDGSGGRSSSDKRLRTCAWAWVCPKPGSNREVYHGARGALGGKQTVPRAELTAIKTCLQDLKDHERIKAIEIFSDCKMAVDGFSKGRELTLMGDMGALWYEIWDIYRQIASSGEVRIQVHKVKGHCSNLRVTHLRVQAIHRR